MTNGPCPYLTYIMWTNEYLENNACTKTAIKINVLLFAVSTKLEKEK
jgi:hypothetical protein